MKKIFILSTALFIASGACADLLQKPLDIKSNGNSILNINSAFKADKIKTVIQPGTTVNFDVNDPVNSSNIKINTPEGMEAKLAQYEALKAKLELQLEELIKQGQEETEKAQQLKVEIDRLTVLIDSITTTISERTDTLTDSDTETESTDDPSTNSETSAEPSVSEEQTTQN